MIQGHSAIDRATVSKTVGWGFESLCPCQFGPIAQLDRALDYESRCREFESLLGHQQNSKLKGFEFFLLEKIEPRVECRELRDCIGFADEYKALWIAEISSVAEPAQVL